MNKIELNNKLRRFFTRFGGGGIKALQYKETIGKSNNGEGELKKFTELTINDINQMMEYPEDVPVCDVMIITDTNGVPTVINTLPSDWCARLLRGRLDFIFSTEEKAIEAAKHTEYGCGFDYRQVPQSYRISGNSSVGFIIGDNTGK